ncbi:MAG: HAD-IIIA family hydrolase [Chromatiales bacterium]|nr:HAD-IIIA family hydrolase [Chromatiales bacterium]
MNKEILASASQIKLVVFDVDGVLTDGKLILSSDGSETRCFNVKDGTGIRLLLKHNIEVAVISARKSVIVANRMEDLGVKHVFQGCFDKANALEALALLLDINLQQVAYVGDDLIDLPAMKRVGLAVAPTDAHETVKQQANWVTSAGGGCGAAREVCDVIFKAQGLDLQTK